MSSANMTAAEVFLRRDPRTLGWALVGSKQFLATLLLSYVYIVKIGGPRFMKSRKAFDNLKPVIMLYNASMVFMNAYFVVNFLTRSYFGGGYNIICQGINYEARDQITLEFLELCWWYLWVRVADFLDTIFFVLRKKDSHVSFLHVIHHVLVVFNGWFGLAYGADGQVALGLALNSFVHVVMYSYYFLSLLGPSARPYLWWKRYLTQFQLVQFVIMFIHCMIPVIKECNYPKTHSLITIPQALFFFGLFIRFYFKSYSRTSSQQRDTKEKDQ
ncbi:elongation of very long chain fatty acids protein AAEL008004 [Ixodes scapularis]|uniref:Elongation of very long chain fatty acids protein n=1 Tax=Ixodes scapularis TaxID=6945 RepID=B7Q0G8_IXOSC|nr:elongation of very long chain fatty acids protein AAEL008004 [Ixodes scapularis]EEC12340.1 fatty acyl-CoA elongase, putative [Ixodes scapularis]|eukprot:XP_002407675.1 fatty acyl-CoA elongase, putative [Ixodes scapularis]